MTKKTKRNISKEKSKVKKKGVKDPYAAREAKKYEQPIASREYLLVVIQDAARPLSRFEIAERIGLNSEDEQEALRRRLIAMVRDGELIRKKEGFYPATHLELVEGRVQAHKDGFGFVCLDEGDDVFLSAGQMRALWHGDIVQARISGTGSKGRREGTIVKVVERSTDQVAGRYLRNHKGGYVEPDDKKTKQRILIPEGAELNAEPGQMVSVLITNHPSYRTQAEGKVVEVLGDYLSPGMEVDIAVRVHNIPHEWPEAVLEQVSRYSEDTKLSARELKDRVDLRHLPLVTIDGEDARDFDDAVFCEPKPRGGWKLYIAIADVSHYVRKGTALDKEAIKRGNSVYFPGQVVPMLPEVLSNGLCSLNPNVDRLCMVCQVSISASGRMSGYEFYAAVMRSHARLTYNQVSEILQQQSPTLLDQYSEIVPHLQQLYAVYQQLKAQREQRGALDFETKELKVLFSADRKIDQIVPDERNEAHRLIEECMLCANVATARFLRKHKLIGLYRVHEGPKTDKLVDVRRFLAELGLSLGGGAKPKPKDYSELLSVVRGRDDFNIIQTVLLRSLLQAEYSIEEKGHFGLAYPAYTHFTSPIRRYPDLVIHRLIRHQLGLVGGVAYPEAKMTHFGEHCSMTERRADEATRDALDTLKCEYMFDKIGETFRGIISAVTHFGIFVQIKDVYIEGLVHVSQLQGDYYSFDPVHHYLMGERTRKVYALGDEVEVLVANVSLDTKMIDFVLGGDAGPVRSKKKAAPETEKQKSKPKAKSKAKPKSASKKAKTKTKKTQKSKTKKAKSKK